VDVYGSRYLMWVASAGLSAVAGALYAHAVLAILPQAFHFQLTFLIVTMVIIGGNSVTGAVVGTIAVSLIAELLRRAENGLSFGPFHLNEAPGLTTIVLGLMIALVLTLRPEGLLGRWELDELAARVWRPRRMLEAPTGVVNESG
jgi:branched-chain amino acid transport system permease protein